MPGGSLTSAPRLALFGKLPAHGDFVRRGDAALARLLDDWLSAEVARLAGEAGEELDRALAALPTSCFVLDGLAGALVPSGDRVGRVFPAVACADGGGATARALADALAAARDGARDADATMAALAVSILAEDDDGAGRRWWRHDDADLADAAEAAGEDRPPDWPAFDRLRARGEGPCPA